MESDKLAVPHLTAELKAEVERFYLLRRDDQTPHHGDGGQDFVVPKDWPISPEVCPSNR